MMSCIPAKKKVSSAETGSTTVGLDAETTSNSSVSPGRPTTITPDLPENAHGLSRNQTPEGSEGDNSNDKWTIKNEIEVFDHEVEEEERKMAEENRVEEEEIRMKLELRDQEEKELKEKRYKRLMHLLNKSEFYSQFLLNQIESQESEHKKKLAKSKSKKTPEKENTSAEETSPQKSTGRGKKRKARSNASSTKRLRERKYNIGDVIDSDMVKANTGGAQEEAEDIVRAAQPRLFENGTMRPYQLDGYSWMTVLYENGVNGILGDEMGLGKTIQCIALVCHLVQKGVPGPFLIIGPLSTLPNWMAEFKRFAPKIPTVLYHGNNETRIERRRVMNSLIPVEGAPNPVHPVVITSYDVSIRDSRILNKYQWRYICVDEGHRLKNHKCRLTQCLNTFPSSNRLLMTGTPLQNNLSELWALLNFLMPEIFDSLDVFESWFDVTEMMDKGSNEKIVEQEKERQVIKTLMKILSPFFLRRVKKDVNLDLPPKRELLVYTPMTPLQLEMYEATLTMDVEKFRKMKNAVEDLPIEYDEKGRSLRKSRKSIDYSMFDKDVDNRGEQSFLKSIECFVEEDEESVSSRLLNVAKKTSVLNVKLQNRMMQCRRIVNHPYLLEYPLNKEGKFKVDDGLVKTCGKLQVLDQLLKELYKRGHRVLIFSQMTMMLDIIEDFLTLRPKYQYRRLDGKNSLEERQVDINDFNADPSIFAFLISTRAGSLGINLASADTVIIYDSDWNPQCDLQAQDRCHRIGQTKPVLVLRLITASSVDEKIVDRASTKRKLEKLIIQSGKFNDGNARLREKVLDKAIDVDELLELLQHRDHDRVHNTNTGNVFSQAELNELLDRSDLVTGKQSEAKKKRQQLRSVFKVIKDEIL